MVNFVNDLQHVSFVVYEDKIYDIVYDYMFPRQPGKTLMCTWSRWSMIWNCYGKKASMCLFHIVKKLFVYV